MSIVGLSNLHYAKMTKDDATGVAYNLPVKIANLISVDRKAASNVTTQFADNGPVDIAETLGEITLDFEVSDLTLEQRADLLGHQIVNGMMVSSITDQPPFVALLFEGLKSNGKKRYKKLLKGMFSEPDDAYKTKEDKITFQTPKISGKFITRYFDGNWEYTADEESATYTASVGTNWYSNVESGASTTAPTISSVVPANNATGVAAATTVVWTLSEAIQTTTATAANFMLFKDSDGTPVAGTVSINAALTQVTFTPGANLAATTAYRAVVSGVKDLNGNVIAAASVTKFTTT